MLHWSALIVRGGLLTAYGLRVVAGGGILFSEALPAPLRRLGALIALVAPRRVRWG